MFILIILSCQNIALKTSPSFTFPKQKRKNEWLIRETVPEHFYYPVRDRGLSYSIGAKFEKSKSFHTPSPNQYSSENSLKTLRPYVPTCIIPKAERFSDKFITIF